MCHPVLLTADVGGHGGLGPPGPIGGSGPPGPGGGPLIGGPYIPGGGPGPPR